MAVGDEWAKTEAAPPIAWMRGAAHRVSAALLGVPSFSHAQNPPTAKAEGAGKEEGANAKHAGEVKRPASSVKARC